MTNIIPIDATGPEFLRFYVVLAAAVLGGVILLRRWLESGEVPRLNHVDPYAIAYLRGGSNEVLKVSAL